MRILEDDYQKYADCIRMEQMATPEIVDLFKDKEFKKWYHKKYNIISKD